MIGRIAVVLLALLPALDCRADLPRTDLESPLPTGEIVEYLGDDRQALEARLGEIVAEFRSAFEGATFGIDAGSKQPVAYEGAIEQAVIDMIRKAPALADEVRKQGGLMTAVFEIRPRKQPANANIYLRVSYSAADERFELRRLVDPASAAERPDITGINVDMPGNPPP